MDARLIGGPFDGYVGRHGDPGVPVIWVREVDGEVRYRTRPAAGRSVYYRAGDAQYIYGDLSANDCNLLVATSA